MISAIKRLGGLSRRLKADNEGVAAVEFALLLPVMLTMYMGCVELSSGYSCLRKVDALARAMSDLTSQSPAAIDATAMNEIVASSKGVMQPFDTTLARVAVSSIIVPNALPLKAYTDWSYTSGGALHSP